MQTVGDKPEDFDMVTTRHFETDIFLKSYTHLLRVSGDAQAFSNELMLFECLNSAYLCVLLQNVINRAKFKLSLYHK